MLLYSRTKKKLTIKAVERRLGVRVVPEGQSAGGCCSLALEASRQLQGGAAPSPPAAPLGLVPSLDGVVLPQVFASSASCHVLCRRAGLCQCYSAWRDPTANCKHVNLSVGKLAAPHEPECERMRVTRRA